MTSSCQHVGVDAPKIFFRRDGAVDRPHSAAWNTKKDLCFASDNVQRISRFRRCESCANAFRQSIHDELALSDRFKRGRQGYRYCMRFTNLKELARTLGLPQAWLRREADAGRIPCVRAANRRMFDVDAVLRALGTHAETKENTTNAG